MELPQSFQFGATQDAGRKATHDFLSLYSHSSSLPQDPRPSHGNFLQTQNFLQPLESGQKSSPKEDKTVNINVKHPPMVLSTSVPVLPENLLPEVIGRYGMRCLPCNTENMPNPEENGLPIVSVTSGDRNDSNCSSYTGGGFILWDDSTTKTRHTGKDNFGNINSVKKRAKVDKWPLDRPSQSSSNRCSSVGFLSSSQAVTQENHSFMEMLKSAKRSHSIEDGDEEDLSIKKESDPCQGELLLKADEKNSHQKASTPRSKHSATEQRRRCKINDRFQMLREIVPHSDQKRDKASFLSEVIEYIQFLQGKVHRYEGPYLEQAKLSPWNNNHGPSKSIVDQPRVANGVINPVLMFGTKVDEKPTAVSLNIPRFPQTQAKSSMINSIDFKTMDLQSGLVTKAEPISAPLNSDVYVTDNASLRQLQLCQTTIPKGETFTTGFKLKDQELVLEGGSVNISNVYSQGLLNTLTCALQNSGVDLSQASISVQVDVGKRANNIQSANESTPKSVEPLCNSRSLVRSEVESIISEPDHTVKKLKTG